jgi:hypothetical protein
MLTLFQCKSVLTYNQSLSLHVVPESQGDAACQDGFLAFPANQQYKGPRVSSINNVFLRGIHMKFSACTLIHWPHVHFWEFDSRSTNQSSFVDMELTWRTSLWSICMGLPSPQEGASGLEVSTKNFGARPHSCFGLSHCWEQSHRGLSQLHQSHLLTQTCIQITLYSRSQQQKQKASIIELCSKKGQTENLTKESDGNLEIQVCQCFESRITPQKKCWTILDKKDLHWQDQFPAPPAYHPKFRCWEPSINHCISKKHIWHIHQQCPSKACLKTRFENGKTSPS